MADESSDNSPFLKRLDQVEEVATTVGLVAAGMAFAAGLGAFLYVIIHVMGSDPPSFGSQGEWLYGAIACLLVAGWGFGQAVTMYARRRPAEPPNERFPIPKVEMRPDGLSIEFNPQGERSSGDGSPRTWSWSFNSSTPIKTIELTEAQLTAAESAARPGVDWDTVARQVNPQYVSWGSFEQNLYRQALQTSVEKKRREG